MRTKDTFLIMVLLKVLTYDWWKVDLRPNYHEIGDANCKRLLPSAMKLSRILPREGEGGG